MSPQPDSTPTTSRGASEMAAIDRAALIEAAVEAARAALDRRARAEEMWWVEETGEYLGERDVEPEARLAVQVALPVIAAGLLAPLRELHVPVKTGEWLPKGVVIPWDACSCGFHTHSDCQTVRMLNQIEADCKGGE